MDNRIAILILAAGESSRMGRPKQLLPWKDATLLDQAIGTAKQVSKDVFVVLGAHGDLIAEAIKNEPVSIINNKKWSNGLGSSISTGISKIPLDNFSAVLIMLADQPLLSVSFYKQMITTFTSNPCRIVATQYDIKVGVPAIFAVNLATELIQLQQDIGAKYIINTYKKECIVLNPEGTSVDIDTPLDYQTYRPK